MLFILAIIFFVLILVAINRPLNYWKDKGVPYIRPWPIVGNLGPFVFRRRALVHLLQDLYKAEPEKRYVGAFLFLQPTLLIRDLELIKQIMVKHFDCFADHKPFTPNAQNDPLASRNLFSLTSANGWQKMRATVSPAFTSRKMKKFFTVINERLDNLIDHFKDKGTVTFEAKDVFKRFTTDVIGSCSFGIACDSLKEPQNEFYKMASDITNFSGLRILKFFGYTISPALMKLFNISILNKKSSDFFIKIIKETIKAREDNLFVRQDMIHLLMEARKGALVHDAHSNEIDKGFAIVEESEIGKLDQNRIELSDVDIAALSVTFLFAGTDTLSTILYFGFYELATHKQNQEQLRQEVDEVSKAELTYESVLGMKYLDCVLSETLRKWSPGIAHDRICVKPFTIPPKAPGETALHVEKGTVIWIPACGIQHDPEYFPDPERFNPERFNDENKHKIKTCSFMPFGFGPRACIGSRFALLECKLLLARVLQNFEIVIVEKTIIPMKISTRTIFTTPDGGLYLGLKPRFTKF